MTTLATASQAPPASAQAAAPLRPTTPMPAPKPKSTTKPKDNPLHSLMAGAIAGSVEISLTYPTEFVKTRLQLPNSPFTSPLHVIRHTLSTAGPLGLYVGLGPMVVGTGAKAAVRFMTYDAARSKLEHMDVLPKRLVPLAAGLAAGTAEAVAVVTPSESVKTRMVASASGPQQSGQQGSTLAVMREVGMRGLWRGVVPVALRQAGNSACRFGSYAWLKMHLLPGNDHPAVTFARGAIAGVVTVYCTMPLDVVKTRMQAPSDGTGLPTSRPRGMVACAVSTVREKGVLALWQGATPRLSRLVFSGAIVFTVYEEVMRVLRGMESGGVEGGRTE